MLVASLLALAYRLSGVVISSSPPLKSTIELSRRFSTDSHAIDQMALMPRRAWRVRSSFSMKAKRTWFGLEIV